MTDSERWIVSTGYNLCDKLVDVTIYLGLPALPAQRPGDEALHAARREDGQGWKGGNLQDVDDGGERPHPGSCKSLWRKAGG